MRRAVLVMLLAFVGVWVALLLGGCGSGSGPLVGSGVEAPAPSGFAGYCARHLERAECGGTQ